MQLVNTEEVKGNAWMRLLHGEPVGRIICAYQEYAQGLAEDIIRAVSREMSWPPNRIDWNEAADELLILMDYDDVSFGGVIYH